jgi:hypothetical protein
MSVIKSYDFCQLFSLHTKISFPQYISLDRSRAQTINRHSCVGKLKISSRFCKVRRSLIPTKFGNHGCEVTSK